ncbi:unnamed protein product [Linum trigynum]|uniref:Uncharacterized protein n=1 Tax=Linum trigynum TaxID=586398 RepID=A0AAV2F993_9ROSI
MSLFTGFRSEIPKSRFFELSSFGSISSCGITLRTSCNVLTAATGLESSWMALCTEEVSALFVAGNRGDLSIMDSGISEIPSSIEAMPDVHGYMGNISKLSFGLDSPPSAPATRVISELCLARSKQRYAFGTSRAEAAGCAWAIVAWNKAVNAFSISFQ